MLRAGGWITGPARNATREGFSARCFCRRSLVATWCGSRSDCDAARIPQAYWLEMCGPARGYDGASGPRAGWNCVTAWSVALACTAGSAKNNDVRWHRFGNFVFVLAGVISAVAWRPLGAISKTTGQGEACGALGFRSAAHSGICVDPGDGDSNDVSAADGVAGAGLRIVAAVAGLVFRVAAGEISGGATADARWDRRQ